MNFSFNTVYLHTCTRNGQNYLAIDRFILSIFPPIVLIFWKPRSILSPGISILSTGELFQRKTRYNSKTGSNRARVCTNFFIVFTCRIHRRSECSMLRAPCVYTYLFVFFFWNRRDKIESSLSERNIRNKLWMFPQTHSSFTRFVSDIQLFATIAIVPFFPCFLIPNCHCYEIAQFL